MVDWKPSASLQNLQQRAYVLAKIRRFFSERDVLEVETPLLASSTVPDVYIESITAQVVEGNSSRKNFLQTSPEFFMKRLLASGSGSIYQIAKAFRQEEKGARHNIEFTLLEWYRLSYSLDQLMAELEELVQEVLGCGPISRLSYRDIFRQHLQIDPHEISLEELQQLAKSEIDIGRDFDDQIDTKEHAKSNRLVHQPAPYPLRLTNSPPSPSQSFSRIHRQHEHVPASHIEDAATAPNCCYDASEVCNLPGQEAIHSPYRFRSLPFLRGGVREGR